MRSPARGEIIGYPNPERLFIEIVDSSHHMPMERVGVNVNGTFQFSGSPPDGGFELRILSETNEVIRHEFVNASQTAFPISIRIEASAPRARPVSGTISAYRLKHKVPRKAMQEFIKADQAYKRKRLEVAIEHLRKSVAFDEGFLEAINNLGGRLMEGNQVPEAAVWFQKAVELDPTSSTPLLNLSIAFIQLGRAAEAEPLARRAMSVEHGSESAGKVLKASLRAQGKPLTSAAFR